MICFDYHQNCRGGKFEKLSVLKEKAQPSMTEFGFFFVRGEQIVRYCMLSIMEHACVLQLLNRVFKGFNTIQRFRGQRKS